VADFVDVEFPLSIAYGSAGGAEFSTTVLRTKGGATYRNRNWVKERQRWNVTPGVKKLSQALELEAFFRARGGMAQGFLFSDRRDYSATGSVIGTGTGALTTFQLAKTYISGPETYSRPIKKPKAGTVKIYLNGVLQSSGYTVSTVVGADPWTPLATGIVTFSAAPGNGVVVTADFEFYIPVIFGIDYLPLVFTDRNETQGYYFETDDFPIIEDRLA
jgi:uncharacterized protein (TIGR02217 family)